MIRIMNCNEEMRMLQVYSIISRIQGRFCNHRELTGIFGTSMSRKELLDAITKLKEDLIIIETKTGQYVLL
jgi:hypothetical protein